MYTVPQPGRSIPSPFADPAIIAAIKAGQVRKERLSLAVKRDAADLRTIKPGSAPTTTNLPEPALAYRLMVRCALLAAEHACEYDEPTYARAIELMRRMPDRGTDRLIALQIHTGKIAASTGAAEASDALPQVWRALLPTMYRLTHAHWHPVLSAAETCSYEKKNYSETSRYLLRKLFELRRTSTATGQ